jgi:hypothetical protein
MFGLALAAAGKVLTVAKDKFVPEAVKRFGAKVSAVGSSLKDGYNRTKEVIKDGASNVADTVGNVADTVSNVAGSIKGGFNNFTNVFKREDIPRTENGVIPPASQTALKNKMDNGVKKQPKKGIIKGASTNPNQSM